MPFGSYLFDLRVSVLHLPHAYNLQSWTKVLGQFQFTQVQPLPSAYKQCWTRLSRIFSEFQLCIGWEEVELQENFEKDTMF